MESLAPGEVGPSSTRHGSPWRLCTGCTALVVGVGLSAGYEYSERGSKGLVRYLPGG